MKFRLLLAFCIIMITNQVYAQKGLRLGVGTNVLLGDTDKFEIGTYNTEVNLKTPVGFSLVTEYGLSDRIMLRSGLEYKFQNVKIGNSGNYRAELISVPLLLDYQFYRNENKRYSFGVTGGISFDRLVNNYASYTVENKVGKLVDIDLTLGDDYRSKALEFKGYSIRLGLNLKKEIANKHQINLFALATYNRGFFMNMKTKYSGIPPEGVFYSEYRSAFMISNESIMIGANYTFGSLR